MSQESSFQRFVTMVTVTETVQNTQELASVWGTIRQECAEADIDVVDAYAVLGEIDFLVVYDAPTRDSAYKASLIIGRHGFKTRTMAITPTDQFADLVEDL